MSRHMRSAVLSLAVLVTIASRVSAQSNEVKTKAAVEAAWQRVLETAMRLDADALTAQLAPDAQFIYGSMSFDREAFRAAAAAAFKGLTKHDVTVKDGRVTLLSSTAAVFAGTGTYADRDTSGMASSGAVAWTVVFRKDKDSWRVINMHEAITPDASVAQAAKQQR